MEQPIRELVLDSINEPEFAMRTEIDRDEIFELAADIKQNGLINPITVRPKGERFEVVAGHRRFLAHRYGGIATIKCIVRELSDDEAFAIMTSENLARTDVNPVDEATHVQRLLEMNGNDIAKVAHIVNRSETWIASRIQIAAMSDELKNALREGKIKLGVALALNEITDATDQSACLGMAISQGASVVVAQYWLAQWRAGLFGHAHEVILPDSEVPGGGRRVVMLRCSVDGKEHPADECTSLIVARKNVGYVDAVREHLDSQSQGIAFGGGTESEAHGDER